MLKRLADRFAIPGWVFLAVWGAIELLDWWDRIEFVQGKVNQAIPFLRPAIDWLISAQGRFSIMVLGFVLLFWAVFRKPQARLAAPVAETKPETKTLTPSAPVPVPAKQYVSTAGGKQRIVVDVTPQYLVGRFETYTSVQATKLAEVYVGKWIQLSGALGDVIPIGPNATLVTFKWDKPPFIFLHMKFEGAQWRDQLSVLNPGSNISIIGEIEKVSKSQVDLQHCELI